MWNQQKDLLLLKEIAGDGILKHKAKSRERGTSWLNVANKLVPSFPYVEVTSRAVRDRYNTLAKKHEFKNPEEERETGLGGEELTEREMLLEELIDIEEETERRIEEESDEKKAAADRDRGQALEMRQRALERLKETFDWLRGKKLPWTGN